MQIITLEHVKKIYDLGQTQVEAVHDISLDIARGDFLSIIGPSGSGKSTLLNLIGCIDKPSAGKVTLEGRDTASLNDNELSELRNQAIGFIFQTFNLIPVLNVFENVEYPLLVQKTAKDERKKRVEKIIAEVELTQYIKHRPDELSGGQRQRVAIARALITRPKLVLADEPSANLDSETGEKIIDLMKKMNSELQTTFVFSTHDEHIMRHAQKIIKIRDGNITHEN